MKLSYMFLALGISLSAPLAAHADTIDAFTLSATMTGGDTMSGTMNIDVTTGVVESGNFGVYNAGGNLLQTFTTITTSRDIGSVFWETIFEPSSGGSSEFISFIPGKNLVGYAGGQLCSISQECSANWSSASPGGSMQSGTLSLTPPVVTPPDATAPEPSSLALLGTGLLGVARVARRRMLSA
jgi:hypothetical protein